MIATIVPFFLRGYRPFTNFPCRNESLQMSAKVATVPEQSTWQNGPEYKFLLDVKVNINTELGYNTTSDFTCRIKNENTLGCQFNLLSMTACQMLKTGAKYYNVTDGLADEFKPFQFDMKFDEKGVRQIIIDESEFTPIRLETVKSMANMLTVGADTSSLDFTKSDSAKIESPGECDTILDINYRNEIKEMNERNWNLELISPLRKLSGQGLHVQQSWSKSKCDLFTKFFWISLGVSGDMTSTSIDKYSTYHKKMLIDHNNFESHMQQNLKKNENEEDGMVMTETLSLILKDIHAAGEEWPQIKDPKVVKINGDYINYKTRI